MSSYFPKEEGLFFPSKLVSFSNSVAEGYRSGEKYQINPLINHSSYPVSIVGNSRTMFIWKLAV